MGLFIQMNWNRGKGTLTSSAKQVSKYLCFFHASINSFKKDSGALLWDEFCSFQKIYQSPECYYFEIWSYL